MPKGLSKSIRSARRSGVSPSERKRRLASKTREQASEVALIRETEIERDLCERLPAVTHQRDGVFNASAVHVTTRRDAGALPKRAREMPFGKLRDICKVFHADAPQQMCVDVPLHACQRSWGHAAAIAARRAGQSCDGVRTWGAFF